MKAKPILNQTRALIGLGVSAGILMASSCMVVSNDMGNKTITKKTVKNDRHLAAHNNNTVRIYPDMIGKTMHVVVK
ncbi:MAG TPA: hypothetical protein VFO70_05820, partial [Chitinophagaceae bacterium]|nr:hypothetical protein [Chitinophagaceae bacterium]